MFPPELERDAFRADNGEFGWTRAQIPLVVDVLRSHAMGFSAGNYGGFALNQHVGMASSPSGMGHQHCTRGR